MLNKSIFLLLMIFSHLSIFSDVVLKDDEDVWFFPTSANQISAKEWNAPIHHWVFEKEEKSIGRKITQKLLSEVIESLDVSEEEANSPVVRQRLMWFLVDNERKKQINISINNVSVELKATEPNGHATTNIMLNGSYKAGDWVDFSVIDPTEKPRNFTGQFQLIPETGVSVISDIDDTIKISDVLDKKELLKNTFVKPYITTQGFPEYYKELEKQGAYFHYVSASPWQLQPSLKPFMDAHYPKGTISLRNFRLKDSSLLAFLQPSTEYKIAQIESIIERYPKHQFILIGDSGEHDPEVYAKIYKQFPQNIKSIQIRSVTGPDFDESRFGEIFKTVPKSIWQVFSKPSG